VFNRIAAVAAAVALAGMSVATASAMPSKDRDAAKPTIVLVHGAWADDEEATECRTTRF
jgi:hypothetical protein